jgi:hypothetical protein
VPLTDRELWLVNFYRNSELHGALLMGRLARTVSDNTLMVEMTAHCATEARHAAMLSRTIAAAGARLDAAIAPIQEAYSAEGGVPASLVEILVLSETLGAIVAEMEAKHGSEHAGWIDEALDRMNPAEVEAARRKWQDVDRAVAARLLRTLDERFGPLPQRP